MDLPSVRRSIARRIRSLVAIVVAIFLVTPALLLRHASVHAAPRVRVVATAKLEVRAAYTDTGIKVFGKLTDDAGVGVAGQVLVIGVASPSDETKLLPLPEPTLPVKRNGEGWELTTGTNGSYAIDIPLPSAPYVVLVKSDKTSWLSSSKDTARLEPGKKSVSLEFPPAPEPPATINLDQPKIVVKVTVDAEGIPQSGFSIDLVDVRAKDKLIANAKSINGVATFDLASSVFGAPGTGEIAAVFSGASGFSTARKVAFVKRIAVARLSEVRSESADGGIAQDGIPLVGKVGSKGGLPATGIIEVFLGAEQVGAATVQDGSFKVLARFRAEKEGIATLTVRFSPTGEGWSGSEGVDVPVRVKIPGPWRTLVAIAAGFALFAVVLRSRRAPRPTTRPAEEDPGAAVRVSKRAKAPKVVDLTVRDLRRRTPIAGARVRVTRPLATSAERLFEGSTDTHGRLRVTLATPVRAGDQILVTHRSALPLAIELPKAAELELGLRRRRDAVLDQLLAFARRALKSRLPSQPTPEQVRKAADDELWEPARGLSRTWSGEVENAVFGADDLDERNQRRIESIGTETEVAAAAPPPPPPPPPPPAPPKVPPPPPPPPPPPR